MSESSANIEDIYDLSPLQNGLLFEVLRNPEARVYFMQSGRRMEGLDVRAYRQAWQHLVQRHAILRTSFHWEGLDKPVQVVHRAAPVPILEEDWRSATPGEQEQRLQAFLRDDRRRGFNLSEAPLLRVGLFRLDERDYQMIWSRHHICLDGWSGPLLTKEIAAIYDALRRGQGPALPAVRPFRDYIAWVQRQDVERAGAFWRDYLRGFTVPTPLPLDRPPVAPPPGSEWFTSERLDLGVELPSALRAFARQHRLTVNTLTQAAWALLLARYCGADDVVFGCAVSGRPPELPGVEAMVGLFLNTLPIRVHLPADRPLVPWLQELQAVQAEVQAYSYSALVDVQTWSAVPRGTALFQSMLAFENVPVEPRPRGRGAAGEAPGSVQRGFAETSYPLSLQAAPLGDRLILRLAYATARHDSAGVKLLLEQLQALLGNLLARPDQCVGDVSLATQTSRQQVVQEWNATAAEYPHTRCLHELFEAQAARTPAAVAVSFAGATVSYAELDAHANRLARHLRSVGAGPEVIVGLCVERSPRMLVALLAILKAGAAYLPLDPGYPRERLAYMLSDAQAAVLVTETALLELLPTDGMPMVCLDRDAAAIARHSAAALADVGVTAAQRAYVIYTSGSTGMPKGVQIVHQAVVNFLSSMAQTPGLSAADRLLAVTTLSFDIAGLELFLPLSVGACVVLASRAAAADGEQLAGLLTSAGVTVMQATPVTWRLLLEGGWPGSKELTVLCGGEAMPPDLALALLEKCGAVWNLYGPTETTVWSCVQRVTRRAGSVPIGVPIGNTQVYVLDGQGQPAPVGVAGELYIGGDGLARGYLGRPALTAERFVPGPFGEPGSRMYRTGDVARWLPDGVLDVLGRVDHQVKVRGYRIELGEIEAALHGHPEVRQAAVAVRGQASGVARLVAYVVPRDGQAPTAAALRQLLAARLPEYMVPAAFVTLAALPLTANGKVDRKALPEPEGQGTASGGEYVAPRTAAEQAVAGVWQTVLNVARVGVADNFFELGGHSLLATRVASKLRTALGVELPLRVLFEAPTVAGLAERIEALAGVAGATAGPPLVPVSRDGPLALSFAQERLWFLDQWNPGDAFYNVPTVIPLPAPVDEAALGRALDAMERRHESLRTRFAGTGDHLTQIVDTPAGVALAVVNLADMPVQQRRREVRRLRTEHARQLFALARGPLWRCSLLRLPGSEGLLLITLHHIITDAWSMQVLQRELLTLYRAFAAGTAVELPRLPVQYADFAAWQRQYLQGDVLQRQLGYWRERLAGLRPLELPTDRPRPAVQTFRGAAQSFGVPADVAERLRALARAEGATLFMTLLAAFQALLGRLSGQDDVAVGAPIAGRNRAELEGLVGVFVNTLVLRADLAGAPTFRQFLAHVKETCLGAYAHQDLPFEKLVEELQPTRDPSRNPLFQVLFTLQEAHEATARGAAGRSGGRSGGRREAPQDLLQSAKFDLTLSMSEADGEFNGTLEYNTDLFDGETARRLAQHFTILLAGIADGADHRLAEIPILSAAARQQVVQEWNATAAEYPHTRCLHELFEAQAARTPAAVAVSFAGATVSYAELDAHANRLARHLRSVGAGPEVIVGLCVERSPRMLVALLAILKAGAAYLPLDPGYPRERLAYMLSDAQAAVLVTETALLELLPTDGMPMVCLDRDAAAIARHSAAALADVGVTAAQRAYVIYTSGSTGMPKGVQIVHQAVVNFLSSMAQTPGLSAADRLLAVTTLSFDIAGLELFLPLSVGACVVLASRAAAADGEQLAGLLTSAGVTVMQATPVTWRLLLESGWPGSKELTVLCGGEAMPPDLALALLEKCGAVWNLYGPTETTVWSCVQRVTRRAGSVPIGVPIGNTQVYVLDGQGQPAPVGVAGELYIGGDGLARGYLGRPALTAERFVPGPFGEPGSRMYRTGDVARWLPDGVLDVLGRVDHQVKVRGYRIELGEIEAALHGHPEVRQAAVAVRGQASGVARLVAYVVPRDGQAPTAAALRQLLAARLPEYMVPAAFVTLAALPLTANGKVDRKALPEPEGQGTASGGEYVAPRTATEQAVAGVWRAVLNVARVGVADHFFELGGHSLLATRVVSKLRTALGVELPLRVLFEAPTVAGLAERIEALAGVAGAVAAGPPLVPVPRDGPLALSFAQERLWFLDQWNPGSAVYNLPAVLPLRGQFDGEALNRAMAEVIRRHEVLRTRFAETGGRPAQVIEPPSARLLAVEDLTGLPAGRRRAEVQRLRAEESRRPFDLAAGPLLRTRLLRLAPEEHLLLLTLHHIVTDAWSQGVLRRELLALYRAFASGAPSPLAELPIQYADYAVWQRQYLQGDELERQLGYWRDRLAGLRALELPTDRPRPAVQRFQGAGLTFTMPADLAAQVRALAHAEGATLFMTLLAAFQALLARYSGQDDVAVGIPIAGRNRAELEDLIGFFVNTLVLRGDFAGAPTFRQFLARVKEACLGAYAHQDLPFEKLVEELKVTRDPSRNPLFQVVFGLQNMPDEAATSTDRPRAVVVSEESEIKALEGNGTSKFDLSVQVFETPNGALRGAFAYNTDLFDTDTVRRMAQHLLTLLARAVAQPDQPLPLLDLLDVPERQLITREWNETARTFPADIGVQRLFEARAQEDPARAALRWRDQEITYGALEARANRLARRLRLLGAGPERPVGLLWDRGPEAVIGLLAILKAGAIYLPLDPGLPDARLTYLLEDARPVLVLTRPALRDRLPARLATLCPEDPAEVAAIAHQAATPPEPGPGPDHAAYLIYTSGSTGRPKGVVVSHRAACNLVSAQAEAYGVGAGSRVVQFASWTFDAAVAEVLRALTSGACLVMADPDELLPGPGLLNLLQRESVSHMTLPPSALAVLPAAGLPDLRLVIVGGETCPESLVDRWGAGRDFVNAYGPTEATVCATFDRCRPGGGKPTIGRPLANVRAYVLDARGESCPVGIPGELYLGGAGVARGYLGRPDLTAEKFVPDPFGPAGARAYRTGDRTRWLADGRLDFLGRVDEQIKVRGYRIEPGEVEAALLQHPGIAGAAVAARSGRLIGYVVGREPGPLNADALRAFMRERVPEYLVPTAFVTLAALPRTPSGKLDRAGLPEPDLAQADSYVAPRTPTEEAIAAAWTAVLGVERVGSQSNFFDLGGHSLLATQVVSRLRLALGVELPLRALFEAPTVAALAEFVGTLAGTPAGPQGPPLVPVPRDGALALSFAQERLWFLDQWEPGSTAYNLPALLPLHGVLDADALGRALNEIVRRHEALRTRFPSAGGQPAQVIDPPSPVPVPVEDLSSLTPPRRRAQVQRLRAEEARQPFDLANGPLLRARLLRLTPEEHLLVLTLHHIATDGWSQGILRRELAAVYRAFAAGDPSPLRELPLQYADFAAWQRQYLQGPVLARQLAYWRTRLAGVRPLELPTDRPRPAVQRFQGAGLAFTVPADLAEPLRALAQAHGATLFMALLAAFEALLGRYSGQDDITVGAPIAGRNRGELEGIVGFFVNTLVLRGDLSDDPPFVEFLGRVKEACLGAYAHQDLPFEKLVEDLKVARDPSRNPLFQVVFGLQNTADDRMPAAGARRRSAPEEAADSVRALEGNGTSKFDLGIQVFSAADGTLRGTCVYNTDLFNQDTIIGLVKYYLAVLRAVAEGPERRLSALTELSEGERDKVLRLGDAAPLADETPIEAPAAREEVDTLSDERVEALLAAMQADGSLPDELLETIGQLSAAEVAALLCEGNGESETIDG